MTVKMLFLYRVITHFIVDKLNTHTCTASDASPAKMKGGASVAATGPPPPPPPGGPVEIVFSFDTTGSMYPCLTQVHSYHCTHVPMSHTGTQLTTGSMYPCLTQVHSYHCTHVPLSDTGTQLPLYTCTPV